MTKIETLVVVAMVVGAGALGSVGTIYLRPAPKAEGASSRVIHTVDWLKAHRPDLKTEYETCRNNPGMAMTDPECINAEAAKEQVDIDDDLASMPGRGK